MLRSRCRFQGFTDKHCLHAVWLSRAIVRKEEAAVKILKAGLSCQQAQLLHEIKIMERCVSAYIVRFLGYSISDGLLILLMEFMPGGTLFKALEEGEAFRWYNRLTSLADSQLCLSFYVQFLTDNVSCSFSPCSCSSPNQ